MREGIHPKYVEATVSCACGNTFKTRSTKPVIKLDICSMCHPFFTGKMKALDTAGRAERFKKKFAAIDTTKPLVKKKQKTKASRPKKNASGKILSAPKKALEPPKKAGGDRKSDRKKA